MIATDKLPRGFTMRIPTMDDAEAAYQVVHACDMADDGIPDHTLEDFNLSWQEVEFNLATDAWLVFAPEGRAIAVDDSGHRQHVKIYSFMRVHPDFRGQGIEDYLLSVTEERARQHIAQASPDARVSVGNWLSPNDYVQVNALRREG